MAETLAKEIQMRLTITANTLNKKMAVPVATIGVDFENQIVLVINDDQLSKENLLQFLQGIVKTLEGQASPIITPGKLFKIK